MPFSFVHIFAIISLFFLFTKYRKIFTIIVRSPALIYFILVQCYLLIYNLCVCLFLSNDIDKAYWSFHLVFEILPCLIFVSIIFIKKGYDLYEIYNIILIVGLLQAGCVFSAMIFPDIRSWMIDSSGSPALKDLYGIVGLFRMYGLSGGYTYTMPLYLGFCVIISFALGAFKSYKYYYLIPFYLISIVVNARIALISILIVSVVIFFLRFRKEFLVSIISLSFLSLLIILIIQFVGKQAENSLSVDAWVWINSGVQEVLDYYNGEATGNLSYLTDSMWSMPKGIDVLIGNGTRPVDSDIGYVIDMYYGGLVYSILLYVPYIFMLAKNNFNNVVEKTINLSVIFYLLMINVKGEGFYPNDLIKGVLLVIIFSIMVNKFPADQYIRINVNRLKD
jgi:hypothetical protein